MKTQNFEYRGESLLSLSLGIVSIIVLLFFGVALTLKLNPIGIILSVIIFLGASYLFSILIKKIRFTHDKVEVTYMFNNKINFLYDSIDKVYYNKEGFLPTHIYVIKYLMKGKLKKATFYCSEKEFEMVDAFLRLKGVRKIINEQK